MKATIQKLLAHSLRIDHPLNLLNITLQNPRETMKKLLANEFMEIPHEHQINMAITLALFDPKEFCIRINSLHFSYEEKLSIIIQLLTFNSKELAPFLIPLIIMLGIRHFKIPDSQDSNELIGIELSEGICYGEVRKNIEQAAAGKPLNPSLARFIQAAHIAALKNKENLPRKIEAKLHSHPCESTKIVPLPMLPSYILELYNRTHG